MYDDVKQSDILDFLKTNKRIVDLSINEDLIYQICVRTGLEYQSACEISNLIFEELINLLVDHKTVNLLIGKLACADKNLKISFQPNKQLFKDNDR